MLDTRYPANTVGGVKEGIMEAGSGDWKFAIGLKYVEARNHGNQGEKRHKFLSLIHIQYVYQLFTYLHYPVFSHLSNLTHTLLIYNL